MPTPAGERAYFYLNAGWSKASIFPAHSYGAELYHNFDHGIETSAGLRLLQFSTSDVTIYTGSLGKYWGDYLFTRRVYDTPSSIGTSVSGSLAVRKYFGDGDTYASFSLGSGISPDQPAPDAELLKLRSRKASLTAQGWIQRRLILSGGLAYQKQDLGPGLDRAQTTLSLGLEWRF